MDTQTLIESFNKVAVASVADAVDKVCGKRGYMASCIKPRINDKRICGPAATVLEAATDEFLPPTHALDLIDEAPHGSVIVISIMGGEPDVAVWGGLMTAGAVANQHVGAVLDGAVRDLVEIRRDYDFPVYARDVSPATTPVSYTHLAWEQESPVMNWSLGKIYLALPIGSVLTLLHLFFVAPKWIRDGEWDKQAGVDPQAV